MKKTTYVVLTVASIFLSGCDDKEARAREKDANPTFMFWCFRKEIVSSDYHIPEMTTPQAATYIQSRLKTVPGYENSSPDLEKRIMTVEYKSSTVRSMNFEEVIALSGFKVNGRPANPAAKIPAGVK
jgi:hypothetical protein